MFNYTQAPNLETKGQGMPPQAFAAFISGLAASQGSGNCRDPASGHGLKSHCEAARNNNGTSLHLDLKTRALINYLKRDAGRERERIAGQLSFASRDPAWF